MKKLLSALFCLVISILLCGCDLFSQGSYYSVEPHTESGNAASPGKQTVSDYGQLRSALSRLVENGSQTGVLYFSEITEEQAGEYMENAVSYIMWNHPIGAYAVEDIRYDIGANAGKKAIALTVSYRHSRGEILRIKRVADAQEAMDQVIEALVDCDETVVFRIPEMEPVDFVQKIRDYVEMNPDQCMELPQVTVSYYPEKGTDRVVEVDFTYQTSRETLRSMQKTVESMFSSAELYVSGDATDLEKLSLLYSFLMERFDYTLDTSITPSYSLLRHGVGDSKAFATVYATMCRRAGVDCRVVSGTRDGNPYYWNVYSNEDVWYHIDLLACSEQAGFSLKHPSELTGYVWDFSIYPQHTEETVPDETAFTG